ncbi:MAG: gliding motility-associated C-terminal domain-containing protein [Bacteroidales bacterium]|nr:gliding motility-associated C-terminal domain-containing protein [Bacteroidales bacterium]
MRNKIYFVKENAATAFSILFLLLSLIVYLDVFAQKPSTKGREFWFAYPPHFQNGNEEYVYISSAFNASGTISIPAIGWSQNFTVPANGTTVITMNTANVEITYPYTSGKKNNKGIHITSDKVISVVPFSTTAQRTEAFLVPDTAALGTEYYMISYLNPFPAQQITGISDYVIVATQDNTTITGSVNTTLNKGEIYLKCSPNMNGQDDYTTGDHIFSDKKVAVYGGRSESYVGNCQTANPLIEVIYPVKFWGTKYIVPPFMGRTKSVIRIMASQANTTVSIDGGTPFTLNAGAYNEQEVNNSAHCVTADKPIGMTQLILGNNCGGERGDPSMLFLNPVDRNIDTVLFKRFNNANFGTYTTTPPPPNLGALAYANIVAKTGTAVQLDGTPVSGWVAVPSCPDYSYATVGPLNNNTHIITGSAFHAYAYSYGSGDDAYTNDLGFNTGISLKAQANPNTICPGNCTDISATINGGTPPYTYVWSNGVTGTSSVINICPTATTTYSVTGTDINAQTATDQITITLNPAINVTATGNSICIGSSGTITAGGADNYTWNTGQTGSMISVNPNLTTTYTVTGSSVNGCTNTASAIVTVNPKPDITAVGGTICNGGSVLIYATGTTSYTWSTGQTGDQITVSPTITTTYIVTGMNAFGCTSTAAAIVNVNALPVVTANGSTVCIGVVATVTASGAVTYTWSNAMTGNSITVNPTQNTTYTVTGVDGNGCINTASAVVFVNVKPNVTASGNIICNGAITAVNASGAVTYSWNTGQTGNSVSVNPSQNTTYTVTGTDGNGCTNTAQAIITVNPNPTVTASGGTVCNGSTIIITASGATTYTWNNGLGAGNPVTVSPSATTTYLVTGMDVNGCTGTASAVVTVSNLTAAANSIDEICTNGQGSVCVIPSGGTPPYLYAWNASSANTSCLVDLPADTYTVTVTDTKNCKIVKTVSIINQIIDPDGIANADKYLELITHTFLFDWNGTNGFSYDWDFGDNTIHSNLKNPTHTYGSKGTYTVKLIVTSPDGCEKEYTFIIEVIQPTKIEVFNVFTPNNDGINDEYKVKYEGEFLYFRMAIFNRWGQKLFETADIDKGWKGEWIQDTKYARESMSDGTYYYVITATGKDMAEYEFHGYLHILR